VSGGVVCVSALQLLPQCAGQPLGSQTDVRDRSAFQEHALHGRAQAVESRGDRPVRAAQRAGRRGVKAHAERMGTHMAGGELLTQQGISTAFIVRFGTGRVDHQIEPAFLARSLPPTTPARLDPIADLAQSFQTGRQNFELSRLP